MEVSIIVSMYKTEKHLPRFLRDSKKLSARLTKNKLTHEIILISNDTSAAERILLKDLPPAIKFLSVPRESVYASWNRGVREARSEFVTFWGVDDTRFASAIIAGISNLKKDSSDYTYFPFRYLRSIKILNFSIPVKIKTFTPPEFNKQMFTKEMHSGPHFIVRRSLFDRIGYFDESFKIAGDFEFQVRAAKNNTPFTRSLFISGIFRNDGTTVSGSRAATHTEENERAKNNILYAKN